MNRARPVISVCIANFNGEQLLSECIDSVLAQDVDCEVEILVHDDDSQDSSLALLANSYPQARVLVSEVNVGFCMANNRMAMQARGEYLLLLNNDATLDPGALQAFMTEMASIDGDAILTLPQYDWTTGKLVDRGCLLDPFYNPVPNTDAGRDEVAYVIGACLWIPRRLWHKLGGFPEQFGSLAEDMYLCCAARLRRIPVYCIDGSFYHHRQGASFSGNRAESGLRTTYRRRALSERNKTWVMLTCTPGWIVWPLLVVHLALLYAEGATLSLLRRDGRLWREVYRPILAGILTSREEWRTLRRRTQAARRTTQRGWWNIFVWMPRKLSLLIRHGLPEVQ